MWQEALSSRAGRKSNSVPSLNEASETRLSVAATEQASSADNLVASLAEVGIIVVLAVHLAWDFLALLLVVQVSWFCGVLATSNS